MARWAQPRPVLPRRQASEQWRTSSQVRAQRLRQLMGRPQVWQGLLEHGLVLRVAHCDQVDTDAQSDMPLLLKLGQQQRLFQSMHISIPGRTSP